MIPNRLHHRLFGTYQTTLHPRQLRRLAPPKPLPRRSGFFLGQPNLIRVGSIVGLAAEKEGADAWVGPCGLTHADAVTRTPSCRTPCEYLFNVFQGNARHSRSFLQRLHPRKLLIPLNRIGRLTPRFRVRIGLEPHVRLGVFPIQRTKLLNLRLPFRRLFLREPAVVFGWPELVLFERLLSRHPTLYPET